MKASLQVRAILARVSTESGWFGRRIDLGEGLCVVHGANASGKSSLMQAIVYCLGLEGMFGASSNPPFPHAFTDWLFTGSDESEESRARVLSAEVLVEYVNGSGQAMTTKRRVAEGARLISVSMTPALTSSKSNVTWEDFYVREGGAMTSSRGFHRHLATYIGWSLPEVSRYDGATSPLYIECIMPLLFIEQKHAWPHIGGKFPTYLQIRDVSRRSVEFLVSLDVFAMARTRAHLLDGLAELKAEWTRAATTATVASRSMGVELKGLPSDPVGEWQADRELRTFLPVGGGWRTIPQELSEMQNELAALIERGVPTTGAVSFELEERLQRAQVRLQDMDHQGSDLLRAVSVEQAGLQAVQKRLAAIGEDLEKYKDYRKLRRLGSTEHLHSAQDECPTCRQTLPSAVVINHNQSAEIMGVEENIAFLQSQRLFFASLAGESEQRVGTLETQMRLCREEAAELRREIRTLRRTLTSDDRSPSEATIARRLFLEARIQALGALLTHLESAGARLEDLAAQWAQIKNELDALPASSRSTLDEAKLTAWEVLLRQQVREYGLRSIVPNELDIDRVSYRAKYQDYDLGFDLSASDTVRATWAYMIGLLELARTFETNHPGFLVLDEPRQQSAEIQSIRSLIRRVSTAKKAGQQVIVATSDDIDEVRSALAGCDAQLVELGRRVLVPLTPDSLGPD